MLMKTPELIHWIRQFLMHLVILLAMSDYLLIKSFRRKSTQPSAFTS
jgi:hypothetical protein